MKVITADNFEHLMRRFGPFSKFINHVAALCRHPDGEPFRWFKSAFDRDDADTFLSYDQPIVLRYPSSPLEDFVVSIYVPGINEDGTLKNVHRLMRNEAAGYQLVRSDAEQAAGKPEYPHRADILSVLNQDVIDNAAKVLRIAKLPDDHLSKWNEDLAAGEAVQRARYGVRQPGAGPGVRQ